MIKEIILQISIWVIVIPLLTGIMNYRGLNKDSKWIFLLVMAGMAPQLVTPLVAEDSVLLNILYNLYTPVEFFILLILFKRHISGIASRIVLISAALYACICGFFFIEYGILKSFLSTLVCINNIFYMLWILLLLLQEFRNDSMLISKSNPFTWYLSAVIIYAPCTIIVFALYHYIRNASTPGLFNLWLIQCLSNILLYLFFTIGLLISKTHYKIS